MDSHFDLIYGELFNVGTKDKAKPKDSKQNPKSDKDKVPEVSDKNKRKLKMLRKAGKEEWVDSSLADWPDNDFRIYCCNLGNEVNE